MAEIEIVGNALCLDFANTVNVRYSQPTRDWLASADQAAHWAGAVGVPIAGSRVRADVLADARAFREVIYQAFSALARGEEPARPDLDALTAAYAAALARRSLRPDGDRYVLAAAGSPTLLDVLDDVAASAVDLLTRGPLRRLGECPSCGWLFLDTSKNGRRRWCSMATCGSRDKARRYYAGRSVEQA